MPEIQDREKAALMHALNFGSPLVYYMYDHEFDPESYLEHNPEIRISSRCAPRPLAFAIDHYYRIGREENRPFIPRTFDEKSYMRLNPDVKAAASSTGDPAKFSREHYLNCGRHEQGRPCTVPFEGFDPDRYYDLNRDVEETLYRQNFCKTSNDGSERFVEGKDYCNFAITHYKTVGYFENRPR